MLDVQRERLRHLLANAILELWKKETGTQSSVLIEGTICITAGSGKTTVVQVSDRFHGNIPELSNSEDSGIGPDVLARSFSNKSALQHSASKLSDNTLPFLPSKTDFHGNPAVLAYLDNPFLPPHLRLPSKESHSVPAKKEPKAENYEQPMETSSSQNCREDSASDDSPGEVKEHDSSAGPVCPGTGYYTCTGSPSGAAGQQDSSDNDDDKDDDGDCESDIDDLSGLEVSKPPSTSTPKGSGHPATRHVRAAGTSPVQSSPESASGDKADEEDALDLSNSKKDGDLALSSPQSYTAQVHDVIRQRLLEKAASEQQQAKADADRRRPLTPPAHMFSGFAHHHHRRSFSQSWPDTRDKPSYGHHLFSPGGRLSHQSFSSPLSIGLPNGPSMMTQAGMSPSIIPTLFLPPRGPGFPPIPLQETMLGCGKPPLTSPSQASSTGSPDDTTHPVFPSPSPTSPDPTDVNGNMEKDPVTGEQKVYKCEFCSKTFLFKSKYHEHLPVHTNARPFQCNMCSRTYKYKYDLRVHMRTHMGIPTKSTVCPFCSNKFSTNKILRIHIKDAHRDRQRALEESSQHSEASQDGSTASAAI